MRAASVLGLISDDTDGGPRLLITGFGVAFRRTSLQTGQAMFDNARQLDVISCA